MTNFFEELYIFEMANSHQGDVEHGIKIIQEMGKIARKYNINAAVKLQYRNLDNFIHPDYVNRQDVPHVPRFMSTRLGYEDFSKMVDAIRDQGMVAMSTPFDEDGVEWCLEQGLDVIKIASCSALDWPLIEAASNTGKPLIISTGGKSLEDIDKIYTYLTHRDRKFAFLHCVAEYPAPEENLQLDFIDKMKKRYPDIVVGYSGHEAPDDNEVTMMAIAKGSSILERHVALPTETIKINAYSMTPAQADAWVAAGERARTICRTKKRDKKYVSQAEIDSLNSLMRGVYVKRDIHKGEEIKREDVFFAMPCLNGQMDSGKFHPGLYASRDYKVSEGIYEVVEEDNIAVMRSIIREAKGMLFEAGINIGKTYEIELSHHYGMRQFRKTGAILINLINREYCKKLMIILPGQNHPTHLHRQKEETFQVLYGDLELVLEGQKIDMEAGDIATVLRTQKHSFGSKNGAIFEEVSTTHIVNDSWYDDPDISAKDPVERKTILKKW